MAITATDQMSPISASIHTVPEPRSPAPRGGSTRFTVPSPARSRSSEGDNGVHTATHLLTADAANQPTPTASQTPTPGHAPRRAEPSDSWD